MQEVTITLKLRVNDYACLEDWVPQLITDGLEADAGEELLVYDDTERVWTAEKPATGPVL
jgi:hypothetical protein